jgi:hypothetical protein
MTAQSVDGTKAVADILPRESRQYSAGKAIFTGEIAKADPSEVEHCCTTA